jgi:hypothetical protein
VQVVVNINSPHVTSMSSAPSPSSPAPSSPKKPKKNVLQFGKYKGKSFRFDFCLFVFLWCFLTIVFISDVAKSDPGYCQWVLEVAETKEGSLKEFRDYLKKSKVFKSDDKITSGKHKGLRFSEGKKQAELFYFFKIFVLVKAKDTGYCSWMCSLGASELGKAPWMKPFREYLDFYK